MKIFKKAPQSWTNLNKLLINWSCLLFASRLAQWLSTSMSSCNTSQRPIKSTERKKKIIPWKIIKNCPFSSSLTFNKALAILFNVQVPDEKQPWHQEMWTLILFVEATNFLLKLSWTLGFIVACVWCNDQSRGALSHLLSQLALGDAKPIVSLIVRENSWFENVYRKINLFNDFKTSAGE